MVLTGKNSQFYTLIEIMDSLLLLLIFSCFFFQSSTYAIYIFISFHKRFNQGKLKTKILLPTRVNCSLFVLLSMSAIDFYCSVKKVKGKDGKDRVVITFDGKYLPYAEQVRFIT